MDKPDGLYWVKVDFITGPEWTVIEVQEGRIWSIGSEIPDDLESDQFVWGSKLELPEENDCVKT